MTIDIPALRERREDIPTLAESFARQLGALQSSDTHSRHGSAAPLDGIQMAGQRARTANAVERAVIFAESEEISPRDLPEEFANANDGPIKTQIILPTTIRSPSRSPPTSAPTAASSSGATSRAASKIPAGT